jgi:flagellar hook-associated protein 2
MATSPSAISFSGSSSFSSSFQQVLTRAVGIASMPLTQMQNTVSELSSQQADLSTLEATFSNLQNAVRNVGSSLQNSLTANVSDSSVVSAATNSTALPGTYTIVVDNLGSSTTTLSNAGLPLVADPTSESISSSSSFTLTVNGVNHTVSPSGSSLNSLAAAINSADLGAQATIVNVGSPGSPSYRLAITSNNLGADTIQLTDSGGAGLLDTLQTGTNAQYKVNGIATDIQSNSRQITLAPGLTVTLLDQSSQPVTITVANSYASLQNTLSNFATAYNSAVDSLSQQRGQNAGSLSGQSILFTLQNTLSSISGYSNGSGPVSSLADLGLDLDQTGHLSFNAADFKSQDPTDLQTFLGATTSGGFLKAAGDALTAVADSTSGSIAGSIQTVQDQITNENSLITQEQTRITDLQNNLMQQLSEADAAIATLESQKNYFTSLFQAMYGNNQNNSNGG